MAQSKQSPSKMVEPGHSKKQSPQRKAITQQGKHQILQHLIWHLGLIMKLAMLQRAQETSPLQPAAYSTYHSFELTLLHTEGSLPTGRGPVVLASSTSWGLHCFQPSPSQLHTIYSRDLSVGTLTLTNIAQPQLFTKIPSILQFSCLQSQHHICDLAKLLPPVTRAQSPWMHQLLGADPGRHFPRQFFEGAGNSFSLDFFLLKKKT